MFQFTQNLVESNQAFNTPIYFAELGDQESFVYDGMLDSEK